MQFNLELKRNGLLCRVRVLVRNRIANCRHRSDDWCSHRKTPAQQIRFCSLDPKKFSPAFSSEAAVGSIVERGFCETNETKQVYVHRREDALRRRREYACAKGSVASVV